MADPEYFCEHGTRIGSVLGISEGGWHGPVSTCGCCKSTFGYIDQSHYSTNDAGGRSWHPKNRCGSCGGEYKNWGVPNG